MKCLLFIIFCTVIIPSAVVDAGISEINARLIQAVGKGDLQAAQNLLYDGENANVEDSNGQTLLFIATLNRRTEIVNLLLDKGADVNSKNSSNGLTALLMASGTGQTEIVKLLLDKSADVNIRVTSGASALILAASQIVYTDIVKLLLSKGADVNVKCSDGTTALLIASQHGCIETVKLLLDKGADVNAKSVEGKTSIMLASGHTEVVKLLSDRGAVLSDLKVQPITDDSRALWQSSFNGQIGAVKLLLDKGVDVNEKDKRGDTPMMAASKSSNSDDVKLLLDKDAYSNIKEINNGYAPLVKASREGHMEIVKLLLDKGTDANVKDKDGNTPLMSALREGHTEIVKLFLDKGADANVKDKDGNTPLMLAAREGHMEIVKLLLDKGADVNAIGEYGDMPLAAASRGGHTAIVNFLLEKGASVNVKGVNVDTPLVAASWGGAPDVVKLLLDKGADVNARGLNGEIPLEAASWEGHTEIVKLLLDKGCGANEKGKFNTLMEVASREGHTEIVKLFLDNNADVNALDEYGRNPLVEASEGGHIEVVKLLLYKGADLNAQDMNSKTPLVAASGGGHVEVVKLLLGKGSEVNANNENCEIPMMAASKSGHSDVVKLLLDKGAYANVKDQFDNTPLIAASERGYAEVVKLLLGNSADVNSIGFNGHTPLIAASGGGHIEVVTLLLDKGADINAYGKDGKTPLVAASEGGHIEVVTLLLDKGADVNTIAYYGRTPLIAASGGGHIEVVTLLLDKGADVNAKSNLGYTPIWIASEKGYSEIVKLLLDNGANINVKNRYGVSVLEAGKNHIEVFKLLSDLGKYSHEEIQNIVNAKVKEANNLFSQSISLFQKGHLLDAIYSAKQSLQIMENYLGKEHSGVANTLYNLAYLYQSMGNYLEAVPLCKRALDIQEKHLAPDDPTLALTLNKLALLYSQIGRYAEAKALFKDALNIREKQLGLDHPIVARILSNLAMVYYEIGSYDESRQLLERSLNIGETSLHPHVITDMYNLAVLNTTIGNYVEAERLYIRILDLLAKSPLGPGQQYEVILPAFDIFKTIPNFANMTGLGLTIKTESLNKKTLDILETLPLRDQPIIASTLGNLALIYQVTNNYDEAELLYNRSLDIRNKTLASNHPDIAICLSNLAFLYQAEGKYKEAFKYYYRSNMITENNINHLIDIDSEDKKLAYLSLTQKKITYFLSMVTHQMGADLSAQKIALGSWLRRKGIVLESQRKLQEALNYGNDPNINYNYKKLSLTRMNISRLYFSGTQENSLDKNKEEINKMEKQRNELEAKLSQLCRPYAEKQNIQLQTSVGNVAQNLPPYSALIEFIRVPKVEFPVPKGQKEFIYNDVVYVVFPDEHIEIIDLGPSNAVDNAVNSMKKEISLGKADTKDLSTISRNLHDLVFAKIKEKLGGDTRQLFISPDGSLSLIPFEVLQDKNGRFLIEDYTFNYLSSGRDILGFGHAFEKSNKALIVGDPDFEKDIAPPTVDGRTQQRTVDVELKIFPALPGTRKEIEEIANIIGHDKSVVYSGKQATEDALFSFHNPKMLHLATHGFFKADQPDDINYHPTPMRDFTFVTPGQMKIPGKKIVTDNPLYRSGLILAGANRTIRGESTSDDGILTAEKILNLRLWGTKLVVLSACDTGLGEVHNGEGIFGLRRTFNQVGAKSLVMSMWKVPDKETQELMVNFYRNIYEKRMDFNKALRQATLDQMQTVKTRYGHANPYYWGAFIFSGDPNL